MSTLSRNVFPSYRLPASATSSPQYLRNSGSLKSGCQISPSLSVDLLARRAPELRYQAGSGSWFEYGIRRTLPMRPRFFQGQIENFPPKLAGLRLNGIPIPAAVSDRRFWKVRFCGRLRNLRNRSHLRPLQWRICGLTVESLKG